MKIFSNRITIPKESTKKALKKLLKEVDNKSTYILEYGKVDENDLIVDKYYIQQWNTTILITQRIINKISSNQSICIISNSDIYTIIDKLSKFIRR